MSDLNTTDEHHGDSQLFSSGVTGRYYLFAILLAGSLLYLSFRDIDWSQLLKTLKQGNLKSLVAASGVLFISYLLRGGRWHVLLSVQKPIAQSTVQWANIIGYSANNVLPARAGELIRSWLTSRETGISTSYALATALIERSIDVVAMVSISLLALVVIPDIPGWLITATQLLAVVGLFILAGLFMLPRVGVNTIRKYLFRLPLPSSFIQRLDSWVEQFLFGLRALLHPRRAISFGVLTLLILLADTMYIIMVAHIFDLSLSWAEALLFLAALGLSSAAPSTPGYIGIYQFVAVTVLVPFGLTKSEALVYIITYQALNYLMVTPWSVIGLWQLRIKSQKPSKSGLLFPFFGKDAHKRVEEVEP